MLVSSPIRAEANATVSDGVPGLDEQQQQQQHVATHRPEW